MLQKQKYQIVNSIEEIKKIIEKNQPLPSTKIPEIIKDVFCDLPVNFRFINLNTLFQLFTIFRIPFTYQEIHNRLISELIIIRDKNFSHIIAVPFIKPIII